MAKKIWRQKMFKEKIEDRQKIMAKKIWRQTCSKRNLKKSKRSCRRKFGDKRCSHDHQKGLSNDFGKEKQEFLKDHIFSSPVHEVLKVSYCDRPMSGVRCPSSVNIFSSVTGGSTGMKLHRKHPLNVLTRIP